MEKCYFKRKKYLPETMIKRKILLLDLVKPVKSADGSSVHRFELVNNLAKFDNEVHIISTQESNLYIDKSIINYNYIYLFNKLFLYVNYMAVFLFLALFKQFDFVYTRNPIPGFLATLILKKLRCDYIIYEINGINSDEQELIRDKSNRHGFASSINLAFQKISDRILEFCSAYAIKNANLIIPVTGGIKEYLIESYGINPKRICVIGNGANIDLFKPIDKKESISHLKLRENNFHICFVGMLAPWQGVEYLIKSAFWILEEMPNTKFLIVGDGIMKKELMDLTENYGVYNAFIFTGVVPYEDVPIFINASDVCVAPFINKRNQKIGLSPLKIFEYMACGKPIVISNISNMEFVKNQNAGFLVEPENPEELAKAIIKLLKDEKLRNDMGRNGREFVIKDSSWKSVAFKVSEACKDIQQGRV